MPLFVTHQLDRYLIRLKELQCFRRKATKVQFNERPTREVLTQADKPNVAFGTAQIPLVSLKDFRQVYPLIAYLTGEVCSPSRYCRINQKKGYCKAAPRPVSSGHLPDCRHTLAAGGRRCSHFNGSLHLHFPTLSCF